MADQGSSVQWSQDEWEQMWGMDDIPWNEPKHNAFFDEHEEEMFGGQTKRVFVPLCGKSKDMLWLYEKGHTVIGVEFIEKAVHDFFDENNIAAETQVIDGVGKLYKSKDGRIELYAADVFSLTKDIVGSVGLIWDSAAMPAIRKEDNERYIELLSSFMNQDSMWYLYVIEYDETVWPGPPQCFSEDKVNELFGSRFTIDKVSEVGRTKKMDNKPAPTDSVWRKTAEGLRSSSFFYQRRYQLKPTSTEKTK